MALGVFSLWHLARFRCGTWRVFVVEPRTGSDPFGGVGSGGVAEICSARPQGGLHFCRDFAMFCEDIRRAFAQPFIPASSAPATPAARKSRNKKSRRAKQPDGMKKAPPAKCRRGCSDCRLQRQLVSKSATWQCGSVQRGAQGVCQSPKGILTLLAKMWYNIRICMSIERKGSPCLP